MKNVHLNLWAGKSRFGLGFFLNLCLVVFIQLFNADWNLWLKALTHFFLQFSNIMKQVNPYYNSREFEDVMAEITSAGTAFLV